MKSERTEHIILFAADLFSAFQSWAGKSGRKIRVSDCFVKEDGAEPDLIIADASGFHANREQIIQYRKQNGKLFLPVLLLVGKGAKLPGTKDLNEIIDEHIYLPAQEHEMFTRVELLLSARKRALLVAELNSFTRRTEEKEVGGIDELLKFAIDLAQIGIYQVDENGSILYANKFACRMTGYSREELLSMKIYQLDPGFDEEGFLKNRRTIRSEGSGTFITRHKRKDGWVFPVEVSVTYFEYKGEFISFSLAKDISERLSWERKLVESEEQVRRIIEATAVGTWSWDIEKDVLQINERWAEICGYRIQELEPVNLKTWVGLVHPDDYPGAKKILDEHLEGRKKRYWVEFRMKHKKGHWVWILSSGMVTVRDKEGNPIRFEGTHLDITDRVNARIQLEESREMYRQLVEDINDVIYQIDNKGQFTYLSPSIVNMTGLPDSWYIGKHFKEIIFPEDWEKILEIFRGHVRGEKREPFEIRLITRSKTPLWVRASSKPEYRNGTLCGVRGTAFNLSQQKESEFLLIEARNRAEESDRLKSAFLANISHEIRTPMNGIVGFAHLLKDSNMAEERKELFLEQIQKSADRMLNLINDLVDISLIDSQENSLREDAVNVNAILADLHLQFAQEARTNAIAFNVLQEPGTKDLIIYSDQPKLQTVLSNLLRNAFKFTREGKIELGYFRKEAKIQFFVTDTGTGIDPEIEPYIFERFRKSERTSGAINQGPGLGLSIAKGFVDQLGGELTYKSEPGKGSTFYFTVPIRQFASSKKPGLTGHSEALSKATLLVVEDDEINYVYIREVVGPHVENILHVTDGKAAVDLVRMDLSVDLVLMDIKLPVMNGCDATRAIKELRPGLPVIAYTAFARPEDEKRARESGCDAYLPKPADAELLLAILKKVLGKGR